MTPQPPCQWGPGFGVPKGYKMIPHKVWLPGGFRVTMAHLNPNEMYTKHGEYYDGMLDPTTMHKPQAPDAPQVVDLRPAHAPGGGRVLGAVAHHTRDRQGDGVPGPEGSASRRETEPHECGPGGGRAGEAGGGAGGGRAPACGVT